MLKRKEAKILADGLENILKADLKTRLQWNKEQRREWEITDSIRVVKSEDGLSYVFLMSNFPSPRECRKVVPTYVGKKTVEKILRDQPWVVI